MSKDFNARGQCAAYPYEFTEDGTAHSLGLDIRELFALTFAAALVGNYAPICLARNPVRSRILVAAAELADELLSVLGDQVATHAPEHDPGEDMIDLASPADEDAIQKAYEQTRKDGGA